MLPALGAMSRVHDKEFTSAATSYDITGLDLDSDGIYYIFMSLGNAVGPTDFLYNFNDDSTVNHYERETILANGNALSSSRANDNVIFNVQAGGSYGTTYGIITKDQAGYVRYYAFGNSYTMANIVQFYISGVWNSTDNLTKITIVADDANGIAIGSRIQLFKVK